MGSSPRKKGGTTNTNSDGSVSLRSYDGSQHVDDDELRPSQRIVCQLICATLPLFIVLCIFLIMARNRPNHPYYVKEEEVQNEINQHYYEGGEVDGEIYYYNGEAYYWNKPINNETPPPSWDLLEMLYIFISIYMAWINLLAYLTMYVPKRRQLIQKYMSEGIKVIGTIQYDSNARCCKPCIKKTWMVWNCNACFGLWRQDYSDLVYTVEDYNSSEGETTIQVTKMVRTFRPWIRERIPVLILPNMPYSGLAKDDVMLDIKSQQRNRITDIYYVIVSWLLFLIFGSIYLVVQMNTLHDERIHLRSAIIALCVGILIGPIAVYGFVYLKFLHYYKWITRSGTSVPISASDVEAMSSPYRAPIT